MATNTSGKPAETATATRPTSQRPASIPSRQPTIGKRPVQFGTAVSRNPATTASRYPKRNSCACHETGSNAVGSAMCPDNISTQNTIASAAHTAAPKKNGRNP